MTTANNNGLTAVVMRIEPALVPEVAKELTARAEAAFTDELAAAAAYEETDHDWWFVRGFSNLPVRAGCEDAQLACAASIEPDGALVLVFVGRKGRLSESWMGYLARELVNRDYIEDKGNIVFPTVGSAPIHILGEAVDAAYRLDRGEGVALRFGSPQDLLIMEGQERPCEGHYARTAAYGD